jgi:hypothetical protein
MSKASQRAAAVEARRIPRFCLDWCTADHLVVMEELGLDAHLEHWRQGGEGSCPEIRNPIDHRLYREGVHGWDVFLQQTEAPDGRYGEELVNVHVRVSAGDPELEGERATIQLTTGEARVLAAQIVSLADRVDLRGW